MYMMYYLIIGIFLIGDITFRSGNWVIFCFSLYSLIFIFFLIWQLCNYGVIKVVGDVIESLDMCITLHIPKKCYIVVKLAPC